MYYIYFVFIDYNIPNKIIALDIPKSTETAECLLEHNYFRNEDIKSATEIVPIDVSCSGTTSSELLDSEHSCLFEHDYIHTGDKDTPNKTTTETEFIGASSSGATPSNVLDSEPSPTCSRQLQPQGETPRRIKGN